MDPDKPIDIETLRLIAREKDIEFHTVVEAFETAFASAYKRSGQFDADEVRVHVDRGSGDISVYAQELDDDGNVVSEWQEQPRNLGRIVAQTARQVLLQRLREAEREATYGEYVGREGDIVSGQVSLQGNVTLIELGRTEALLPYAEQVPNERLNHGQHTRAIVTEVRRDSRRAQIICSRSHPGFVAAMFALEVPEIEDGTVEIKAIAREAGHRSKVAVVSNNTDVDPVGACVGPGGERAKGVQRELHNEESERIDIIRWSDEPEGFVANALSPAKVTAVYLYPEDSTAMVVVPDYQLSLAIGREGQNARLAARLTGWRIDIKSESQFEAEQAAFQEAFDKGLIDEFGNPLSQEGEEAIAAAYETAEETRAAALEESDDDSES
ncbi:transcription termination factor NusA [Salsipaludibacter albus]|uniref:transcription termination factor NusA n=1 Tax=Salsipaludibacter albus TaxID=2849650 RepID=UPI001EE3F4F0|nr:transcription termination factor NusA [Salsipaludibacter albus]MBY5162840.1 transcription termination factor NusA [Salsipaludibacter albus]